MSASTVFARELEPFIRRAQVHLDTNPSVHSPSHRILRSVFENTRGFEERTAERVYNLNLPYVSDFFGAMYDERSDGAPTNLASVRGFTAGAFRSMAENTLMGVHGLVTEPQRTLMNMAVGVTSFQARPGETIAGFTYGVIYWWNNSSTDARGAAVVEAVANNIQEIKLLPKLETRDYFII